MLVGFFEPHLAEQVNPVNVWNVARDRGIEVLESTSNAGRGYASLVRVSAHTSSGEHSVAGTVFDQSRSRVVELDGLPVELAPEGHLLMFANDDVPGVVGAVGTFLGEHGINIADVRLARADGAETAIAVMALDQAMDPATVEEFEELHVIKWAQYLEL